MAACQETGRFSTQPRFLFYCECFSMAYLVVHCRSAWREYRNALASMVDARLGNRPPVSIHGCNGGDKNGLVEKEYEKLKNKKP